MKTNKHPTYHRITVSCACGTKFETGSTHDSIQVEICSACHPFYTGEMRFVDTMGRVEKFEARRSSASSKKAKKQKVEADKQKQQKTLKEMLEDTKIKSSPTPANPS